MGECAVARERQVLVAEHGHGWCLRSPPSFRGSTDRALRSHRGSRAGSGGQAARQFLRRDVLDVGGEVQWCPIAEARLGPWPRCSGVGSPYAAPEPAPPSHTQNSLPSGSAMTIHVVPCSCSSSGASRLAPSASRRVASLGRRGSRCRGACGSCRTWARARPAGAASARACRSAAARRSSPRRRGSRSRAPGPRTRPAAEDRAVQDEADRGLWSVGHGPHTRRPGRSPHSDVGPTTVSSYLLNT